MSKITIIPSWYPIDDNPFGAIFAKEQPILLKQNGIDVSIFFSNLKFSISSLFTNLSITRRTEPNIPLYTIKGFTFPKRGFLLDFWAYKHYKLFNDYIAKEGRPDLLHAHSFIGGYLAMKISKKFQIPYIVTEHHMDFLKDKPNRRFQKISKKVFENANLVIGVSQQLTAKLKLLSKTETIYIPNIVDHRIFYPKNIKAISNNVKILCIANLENNKNIEKLLHAFRIIDNSNSTFNFYLTIIGSGENKLKLKKLSQKLMIESKIEWINSMSRSDIANKLRVSDIFVLPSDFESFGVVLIESIACGTPVICTSIGGPSEIIKKNNGIHLLHCSSEQLAQQIQRMSANLEFYEPQLMSKDILGKYGSKIILDKIIYNYENIIKK